MTDGKAKGDRAEREIARLISGLTGQNIVRKLGAGRREDVGDLHGLEDWTAQVADWSNALRAIREKPEAAEDQRLNADTTHAVTFIRLRGGLWRAVQTLDQWATSYDATRDLPDTDI